MTNTTHLDAIIARLNRETERLENAQNETERGFREMQVAQAKKELASEYEFLGIQSMNDGELLAELHA